MLFIRITYFFNSFSKLCNEAGHVFGTAWIRCLKLGRAEQLVGNNFASSSGPEVFFPRCSVQVTKSSNSSGRLKGPLTVELHFTRRFQSTPGSLTQLPVRARGTRKQRNRMEKRSVFVKKLSRYKAKKSVKTSIKVTFKITY
jgi:hypothetical protein